MMRIKNRLKGLPPKPKSTAAVDAAGAVESVGGAGGNDGGAGGSGGESGNLDWELRPGGMLVQKRPDSDQNSSPEPTIRVRVKHGPTYHEITVRSQATFGELKKRLQGVTGLHHQDQKLLYKDKERDSKAFLDIVGVKDNSKIELVEDPISQEKRYLEMRKNAKMEKAARSISEISLVVDRLAGQVSALESVISKGGKVAEKDALTLTELLMNELIRLDAIVADGDVKLQRRLQVKRVQKYVETLDMLKVKNLMTTSNGGRIPNQNQHKYPNGHHSITANGTHRSSLPIHHHQQRLRHHHPIGQSPLRPLPEQQQQLKQQEESRTSKTVVTTQWETFDSSPPVIPVSSSDPPLIELSPTSAATSNTSNHKFNWEHF